MVIENGRGKVWRQMLLAKDRGMRRFREPIAPQINRQVMSGDSNIDEISRNIPCGLSQIGKRDSWLVINSLGENS